MSTQNIASLMDQAMKQSTRQFHKIFFHISEKLLQFRITKKRMNITNFINIQIYIPILYVTKMNQNKNDSINLCY